MCLKHIPKLRLVMYKITVSMNDVTVFEPWMTRVTSVTQLNFLSGPVLQFTYNYPAGRGQTDVFASPQSSRY